MMVREEMVDDDIFKYFSLFFIICVRMVDGWEDVQQISENEMVDGEMRWG